MAVPGAIGVGPALLLLVAGPPGVGPLLLVGPVVVDPVVVGVVVEPGWVTVTVSWSPPPPPLASVTSTLTVQTPAVANRTDGAA